MKPKPRWTFKACFFLLYPVYQDELAACSNYLKALTELTAHQRRPTLNSALPDGLFHFCRGNGNGIVHWLLQLNWLHCLHNFQQEHFISVILEPLELAGGQRKHVYQGRISNVFKIMTV